MKLKGSGTMGNIKFATDKGIETALNRARERTLNYLVQYSEFSKLWSDKERQKRLRKRFKTLFRTYEKKHNFSEEQVQRIKVYTEENFPLT